MAREFVSGHDESLPDMTVCRVLSRAMDGLCLCLNPRPQGCEYLEQFQLLNYCFHPDRLRFVDGTETK
jgi:hypothetical protein